MLTFASTTTDAVKTVTTTSTKAVNAIFKKRDHKPLFRKHYNKELSPKRDNNGSPYFGDISNAYVTNACSCLIGLPASPSASAISNSTFTVYQSQFATLTQTLLSTETGSATSLVTVAKPRCSQSTTRSQIPMLQPS
jgi:hypothetical protein